MDLLATGEELEIAAEAADPPAERAGEPSAPALAARDIWLTYNKHDYVLRGVGLTIERGRMAMVLGRSGSGKTTLLKILAGLLTPQRGMISIVGRSAASTAKSPYQRVAYVPQTLGLVRNMSALENTLAGALRETGTVRSLLRLFPRSTMARAKESLAGLGLADKMNERVYNLSGGERQRVAIARALMQEPDIILADEFVSQLDPVTTDHILEMMRAIANEGVSLLITTHEIDVVVNHADQLLIMRSGTTTYDGRPKDVPRGEMVELLR